MATKTTKPEATLNKENIISRVTASLDGAFSEKEIIERRRSVFYQVANLKSPQTGTILGSILDADELGTIVNNLLDLQQSRKLTAKLKGVDVGF